MQCLILHFFKSTTSIYLIFFTDATKQLIWIRMTSVKSLPLTLMLKLTRPILDCKAPSLSVCHCDQERDMKQVCVCVQHTDRGKRVCVDVCVSGPLEFPCMVFGQTESSAQWD